MTTTHQRVMLGVLLCVMALVYARPWHRPAPRSPIPVEAPASVAAGRVGAAEPALVLLDASTQRHAQRQRAAELVWGRDPFTAAAGEVEGLSLSGIIWDPAQPMAIINGQPLQIGAEVDGYHIVDITQESVTVTDGPETFRLTLSP